MPPCGGLIETAPGNAATLDGTSQGALTIAGTYQGSNNSTTFLNGTINNTGTISINAGGNSTDLRIADRTERASGVFPRSTDGLRLHLATGG